MKFILTSYLLILSVVALAQCPGFPATVADGDCGSFTSLANNSTINSGQTLGVCNSSTGFNSFSGISLSGGIIRICGNTSLSGSFNSGTIVVACGATLDFPAGLTLNQNIGIVNYGTVTVTGNLTFQNNNNYFYNESTTSRLYVSGDVIYPQNNGQNAYLKNNGYISIGDDFNAYEGGFTCLGPESSLICRDLRYMNNCGIDNRFTYAGNTDNPIIQYTATATIKANFTASNFIDVFSTVGATAINNGGCGAGSWGNANLTINTPIIPNPSAPDPATCTISNCFTTLPITLISFIAEFETNKVILDWQTASEINNDYFTIERSIDAIRWQKLKDISGAGNSSSLLNYTTIDNNPYSGISYYRLKQTDFDGQFSYSKIKSVNIENLENLSVEIFPNPTDALITIVGNSLTIEEVKIYNMLGQDVTEFTILKNNGENIGADLSKLKIGMYFVKTRSNATKVYKK